MTEKSPSHDGRWRSVYRGPGGREARLRSCLSSLGMPLPCFRVSHASSCFFTPMPPLCSPPPTPPHPPRPRESSRESTKCFLEPENVGPRWGWADFCGCLLALACGLRASPPLREQWPQLEGVDRETRPGWGRDRFREAWQVSRRCW